MAYIGDTNRSRAGGAAAADNATTAFTNPAGMNHLSGDNWVLSSDTYLSSATFKNQGSTDVLGAPLSGGNGGDGGATALVPGIYYGKSIGPGNHWAYGMAINSPFGLSTEYDRNWVGRYSSVNSGIKAINFNPSLGYKLNTQWSLGFGIDIQYAEAQLSSAVDFGAICYGALGPATCGTLGMQPQNADGFAEIKGSDWSPGYNFGVLWSGIETRAGLSYRSAIKHRLKGTVDFSNPPQAAVFSPMFTDTDVQAPITMPEVVSLSAIHNWTPQFTMLSDITYTRWSRIKQFQFDYANPAQPDQTLDKNWKDTTRFALGFDYKVKTQWNAQWGIAYEPSAIPDSTFDPSIPISDAIWFTAGANYQYTKNLALNFGLVHIMFRRRDVNLSGTYGENLKGEAKAGLNVVNAQLIWNY